MNRMIDLSNKSIIIAAASSQIGEEAARLCSQLGARIAYIDDQQSGSVPRLPKGENPKRYELHFRDTGNIESFIKQLIAETGPADGFVYIPKDNANNTDRLNTTIMQEEMDDSFRAFIEITRCMTKRDCYRPGFSIVCVSVKETRECQEINHHDIANASLEAAVRCIAKELSPNGRANTVSICSGLSGAGTAANSNLINMIAFLLSDASRLITGTTIEINTEV